MTGVREITSVRPARVPRPQEYCSDSPPEAVKAVRLNPMLEALVHTLGSWNLHRPGVNDWRWRQWPPVFQGDSAAAERPARRQSKVVMAFSLRAWHKRDQYSQARFGRTSPCSHRWSTQSMRMQASRGGYRDMELWAG